MPVDFVTVEQERRYGRFNGEPSEAQLSKYFYVSETDFDLIRQRRGDQNRLGFALQICTVRFLGTFLANPIDVPPGAVAFVAAQLGITDLSCLPRYLERETTHREHAGEIQRSYEYQDFIDQPAHFQLVRWLYTRAWLTAERPSVLFDLATARLVDRKILLPGVNQLARLVASVRDHAQERLWRVLAQIPTTEQRHLLETLLIIPEGERQTPLDRLRRAPTRVTAPALVAALHRIDAVRLLGVRELDLSFLPAGRIKALARYVQAVRIQTLSRMPEDRRRASLLGLARNRINLDLIARNWDDMLRVAGSLKLGTVGASTLIRALQGGGRPTTLARAISEVGRIAKSLHLLSYADDEFFRRRIQIQLNRGEGRHAVARDVFHGQKGELRQRYREGQEDQLVALGLVVNILLLWNTLYMQDALDDLRAKGHEVLREDIERLSPLTLQHMNLQGTYHLTLPESVAQGNHRPLRRPSGEEPPNGTREM